jgi:Tfp pilus assembly protein FimT
MSFRTRCGRIKSHTLGYTLVELVSVLVIFSLVALLTFPRLQTASYEMALRHDAAILARELRLTRQTAITSGQECDVAFIASTAQVISTSYRIRANGKNRMVQLSHGVTMVGSSFARDRVYPNDDRRTACCFLPSGTPTQGGTVNLQNVAGKHLYIAVTPVTARIRVSTTDPHI